MSRAAGWWRHAGLAGCTAGLLASPHLAAPAGWEPCALAAFVALGLVGRAVIPAAGSAAATPLTCWLCALIAVSALVGLGAGGARVAAIDGGALIGGVGERVSIAGFIDAVPRRSYGEVRVPLATPDGRVVLVGREPVGALPVGRLVHARGRLVEPDPFRGAELERLGAALELHAERIELTPAGRGGLVGAIDGIRERAEAALGEGMGEAQAALARGFVLGQDDLIDPVIRDEFKRSGLAHLLSCYEEDKTFPLA